MDINEQRKIISDTVLGMRQSFTRGDLCRLIIPAHPEIKSGLILDIVDELYNAGVVTCYLTAEEVRFSLAAPSD
jgi:hypothetical protein